MIASPYAPGATPEQLAGRGAELAAIRDRLERTALLARSSGPLLAFHGSRGLGKTSLLRRAQGEAASRGFLTVWVTGRDDVALAPELATWIAAEVRSSSLGARARALLASLERLEIGVPGARIGVGTSDAGGNAAIEQSLASAARFAREQGRPGLAVFVDEFQEARLADRRSLLIALQHFDGQPDGCPVAVFAAGLPSLLGAVPQAATFGERTDFREIGLLGEVSVAEALAAPAERHEVTWEPASLEVAWEVTRGYPHHVQLLGDETWRAARPAAGHTVTPGQVRLGAERAEGRMEALFRSRMARLSPGQRDFLLAVAHVESDDRARRADIAADLGVDHRALSRPRQEMIDRGLVEPAGHGRLRFTVPGFGNFLREQEGLGTYG